MSNSMKILTLSNVWSNSAIRACTWLDVAWLIKERISSMEFCKRKRSINWSIHSVLVANRLNSENRLFRRSLSTLAERKKSHACLQSTDASLKYEGRTRCENFHLRNIIEDLRGLFPKAKKKKNCCNYERNYRLQGRFSCLFFFFLLPNKSKSRSRRKRLRRCFEHVAINATMSKKKRK